MSSMSAFYISYGEGKRTLNFALSDMKAISTNFLFS